MNYENYGRIIQFDPIHVPSKKQEWKDGKFQEVERVNLKKRWPDKWEKDWLGW